MPKDISYCKECRSFLGHQDKKKNPNSNVDSSICQKIVGSDGLPIRCVGDWGLNKVNYISRYFYIFATSMREKWEHINYIEICSGPGVCVYRTKGDIYKENDGTALSIIKSDGFKYDNVKALFIDINDTVVDTLNTRIRNLGQSHKAKAIIGDYNKSEEIIKNIKENLNMRKALNLVVIDPTDCSVPFETIKNITSQLKADVIINFAYGTDLLRNIVKAIKAEIQTDKYKKFLGSEDFFERHDIKKLAKQNDTQKLLHLYYAEYKINFEKLNYKYNDIFTIEHFYALIFLSEHKLALKFWKAALKKDSKGQSNLFT